MSDTVQGYNDRKVSTILDKIKHRKIHLAVGIVAALVFTGGLSYNLTRQNGVEAKTIIAVPSGSSSNDGSSVADGTNIQAALDKAQPGDVIQLEPGTYQLKSPLTTKTSGTAERPITIKGTENGLNLSDRNKTVVTGTDHVFDIEHNYYVLDGFTIDGQPNIDHKDIPLTLDEFLPYRDKNQKKITGGQLVYIGNKTHNVTGTVINNMLLEDSGSECIRMRNLATKNVVSNSMIVHCGLLGKKVTAYAYHNGEGVYIGTSPKSAEKDPKKYMKDDDTNHNVVRNNVIQTFGSECVNIKENASYNVAYKNDCSYSTGSAKDKEALLETRGKNGYIVGNSIKHSSGLGIKLASDTASMGGKNVVADNVVTDIKGTGILAERQDPQEDICGNTSGDGKLTVAGNGIANFDPSKACSKTYPPKDLIGDVSEKPNDPKPNTDDPPTNPNNPNTANIKSIVPAKSALTGGITVTITVAKLPNGTPSVTFGGKKASSIKRVNETTVRAKVPAAKNAGSVPVIVQVKKIAYSSVFTYGAPDSGHEVPKQPNDVILSDSFTKLDTIKKVTGGTWKTSKSNELELSSAASNLSVGNSNIAIEKNKISSKGYSATFSLKVTGTDNKFNDLSFIFDYADQKNYSFVSFNESNDDNSNGIFSVVDGKVSQVADIPTLLKTDVYHTVSVSHSATGNVTVTLDSKEVAKALMPKMAGDYIGFGSRNDNGRFDDLTVKKQ